MAKHRAKYKLDMTAVHLYMFYAEVAVPFSSDSGYAEWNLISSQGLKRIRVNYLLYNQQIYTWSNKHMEPTK